MTDSLDDRQLRSLNSECERIYELEFNEIEKLARIVLAEALILEKFQLLQLTYQRS